MFFADLHIHSKFSRATGKDADLEHMALWGRKKGVTVMGESSKAVQAAYEQALAKVGSELFILDQAPPEELRRLGSPVLADAIERMREGRVIRDAGYDGEYGVIRVFQPGELANRGMKSLLFEEAATDFADVHGLKKAKGNRSTKAKTGTKKKPTLQPFTAAAFGLAETLPSESMA